MTREEAKDFYPILQAFAEGKVIECRTKPSSLKGSDTLKEWTEMGEIEFWNNTEYRIKPKYRPFKNKEECWQEMLKHQPFGWVKYNECYFSIVYIDDDHVVLADKDICSILLDSEHSCKDITFADGTPFGIREE